MVCVQVWVIKKSNKYTLAHCSCTNASELFNRYVTQTLRQHYSRPELFQRFLALKVLAFRSSWMCGANCRPDSESRTETILRPCYTKQFFLQLETQQRRIKNLSSCRGGVTRLQFFSQFATRTITNKMAEISHVRKMSSDWRILTKLLWKLPRDCRGDVTRKQRVSQSRGSFYFSCNSQRNNCSCKMWCYTWIFSCKLKRNVCCVASCKKNCFVLHRPLATDLSSESPRLPWWFFVPCNKSGGVQLKTLNFLRSLISQGQNCWWHKRPKTAKITTKHNRHTRGEFVLIIL